MEREGAILWPEAEAVLCESRWVHENVFSNFPDTYRLDPIHLGAARIRLAEYGYVVADPVVVGDRLITAYLHGPSIARYGRVTAVRETAAAKRRLYRRFIQWTGRNTYCGGHAERLVASAITPLKGTVLWVPESARTGRVHSLLGRELEVGGPLDAAGFWVTDPDNPGHELVPFAVEVKNIRSVIYP